LLLDFTVGLGKSYFFACSPQEFTASRWSKINLLENYTMVSTLWNRFLLEFLEKKNSNQILVEQGKVQLLLEKPSHFSEKKSQKSGIRSGILIFFFILE
jgi:hypothetical protein